MVMQEVSSFLSSGTPILLSEEEVNKRGESSPLSSVKAIGAE